MVREDRDLASHTLRLEAGGGGKKWPWGLKGPHSLVSRVWKMHVKGMLWRSSVPQHALGEGLGGNRAVGNAARGDAQQGHPCAGTRLAGQRVMVVPSRVCAGTMVSRCWRTALLLSYPAKKAQKDFSLV